jgi:hypothetical protein
MNPLLEYFEAHSGPLIYKWMHYFDAYHRHFERYRGQEVYVLEIGVYQGGSLGMWRHYFGERAKVIGIDIDPRCKQFEGPNIEILIGDQSDRSFLRQVKEAYPRIDVVIDDGSHFMQEQITTFEELFPHVHETGVYLCEDLHTSYWKHYNGGYRNPSTFIEYSKRLIDELHAWHSRDPESFLLTPFTQSATSMHFYDSILVIEKQLREKPYYRKQGKMILD